MLSPKEPRSYANYGDCVKRPLAEFRRLDSLNEVDQDIKNVKLLDGDVPLSLSQSVSFKLKKE
jgi:hypothetical protein